jgi:hypothetical protein
VRLLGLEEAVQLPRVGEVVRVRKVGHPPDEAVRRWGRGRLGRPEQQRLVRRPAVEVAGERQRQTRLEERERQRGRRRARHPLQRQRGCEGEPYQTTDEPRVQCCP